MPVVKVRNLENEEIGEVELSDKVFGAPLNKSLIYYAVKGYLANQRAGTSATKTRGDTSGSGRKPWRQKGTGRARIASLRSPLWRGGGNVHGPQPRDWSYRVNRKVRRGAMCSVLSERLREGGLIIVDDFTLDSPRTRDFVARLKALGLEKGTTLIVATTDNQNLFLSSRNLRDVKYVAPGGVNVYELLTHERIAMTREAASHLDQQLGGPKETGDE